MTLFCNFKQTNRVRGLKLRSFYVEEINSSFDNRILDAPRSQSLNYLICIELRRWVCNDVVLVG
jgi:hypothetical protein